jgi:hypothetical protein
MYHALRIVPLPPLSGAIPLGLAILSSVLRLVPAHINGVHPALGVLPVRTGRFTPLPR